MKACLLALLFSGLSAHGASFSLLGALNYSKPVLPSGSVKYNPVIGFGGGALLNLGLSPRWTLEVGALAVQRKYETTLRLGVLNSEVTSTQTMLELPVLARLWLGDSFSVAGGGYYGRYFSYIRQKIENSSGESSATLTYERAGQRTQDYGLAASLALLFPWGSQRLLVDVRYLYGLSNNSTTGPASKFQDLMLLLGLSFGGKGGSSR